jgi:glutaminyl-peptide cyclotransferase
MNAPRLLPTLGLLALAVLAAAPVGLALHNMADPTPAKPPAPRARPDRSHVLAGFDGDRAYRYLLDQCKIGPRISGTEGNRKLRRVMADHFRAVGAELELQSFEVRHPLSGKPVEMENVVAKWIPGNPHRVLIGAHFDTRPRPDNETDPRRKAQPFLGANDGGSGVAVLMELGHIMADLDPQVGVDLVMFDGEELVYDHRGDFFLGSGHFAELYHTRAGASRYDAAIVVDMVGDADLQIYADDISVRQSPELVREVWAVAERVGAAGFKRGRGHDLLDDHVKLLEVGIPAIDLIDFDYPHWHLASDTPDKCSAESLAQVGGVLAEWLRGRQPR